MNAIDDVSEADGSMPPSDCKESRLRLVRTHMTADGLAFRFFSDEYVHPNFPEVERDAAVHVRGCSRCRDWIRRVVPVEAFARAERMSHYCCSWMFATTDEGDIRLPKMEFTMFRGEDPCWCIEGKNAFASFCPWCGKRLPNHPFIEHEKGKA